MIEDSFRIAHLTNGMYSYRDLQEMEWNTYEYLKDRVNEILDKEAE